MTNKQQAEQEIMPNDHYDKEVIRALWWFVAGVLWVWWVGFAAVVYLVVWG